jgi:hypothetical protein
MRPQGKGKQQQSDDGDMQTYIPISRIHVIPHDGPEVVDGVTHPHAINRGRYIGVVIELQGNADSQQMYFVQVESTPQSVPPSFLLTVNGGVRYSNIQGFPGPTQSLPGLTRFNVTPVGGGEPTKTVQVWFR